MALKFIINCCGYTLFNNTFYSGTSGIITSNNPELIPSPEFQGKSRLTYYASLFNRVEINTSFYKLPRISTVIKWADSVPPTFQFTFKLSKAITHAKGLNFNQEDVRLFMHTVDHIWQ